MISGAAQADCGVLVIPATTGEFESGFSEDGQTREHAILAKSLGISQLIVAVNKMGRNDSYGCQPLHVLGAIYACSLIDSIDWKQSRFDDIVAQLLPFLKTVGFKETGLRFLPVSGLSGENIREQKETKLSYATPPPSHHVISCQIMHVLWLL